MIFFPSLLTRLCSKLLPKEGFKSRQREKPIIAADKNIKVILNKHTFTISETEILVGSVRMNKCRAFIMGLLYQSDSAVYAQHPFTK